MGGEGIAQGRMIGQASSHGHRLGAQLEPALFGHERQRDGEPGQELGAQR